jgi:hypothetical protein
MDGLPDFAMVSEAAPLLHRMLQGGSAVLVHGGEFRMLWYDPRLHRSSFGLQSLLSGAGHGCELRVHEAKTTGSGYPSAGTLLRTINFATALNIQMRSHSFSQVRHQTEASWFRMTSCSLHRNRPSQAPPASRRRFAWLKPHRFERRPPPVAVAQLYLVR